MNPRTSRTVPSLVFAGLTVGCFSAHASFTVFAGASGSTTIVPGEITASTPSVATPITQTSTPGYEAATGSSFQTKTSPDPATPRTEYASVQTYAAAQAGSVHVSVSTTAFETTPSVLSPDGSHYLPDPNSSMATAGAQAGFTDGITLQSSTLPIGTPVTFTENFYIEGSFGGQFGGDPTQQLLRYHWYTSLPNGCADGCGGPFGVGSANFSFSGVVSAKIGDKVTIVDNLSAGTTSIIDAAYLAQRGPLYWTDSNSTSEFVNFANTSGVWISNASEGVDFNSDSGFDYTLTPLLAVSEPGSATLLLYGVAILGGGCSFQSG